jgi:hypothetical protein
MRTAAARTIFVHRRCSSICYVLQTECRNESPAKAQARSAVLNAFDVVEKQIQGALTTANSTVAMEETIITNVFLGAPSPLQSKGSTNRPMQW